MPRYGVRALEQTPCDIVSARRNERPPTTGGRKYVKAMTCGEAVMKLLSAYGVDTVFGMAGTMTVELYRGIALAGIRHVQCRNEQGASLMADGYARATGKPGVCAIIAGPGVTNAATGIAQAYCDSQPMLVLSGACATHTQGKGWGAIHELDDQTAVTAGFTAFSAMVRYPDELPELIARAYAVYRFTRFSMGCKTYAEALANDRHLAAHRSERSRQQCRQGDIAGLPPPVAGLL